MRKICEEKRTFCKSIRQYANFFSELQCLADDLVDLELSMFINFLFLKNISFNEVVRGFEHGKKIPLISLFLEKKTLIDDLN